MWHVSIYGLNGNEKSWYFRRTGLAQPLEPTKNVRDRSHFCVSKHKMAFNSHSR